MKWVYIVIGFVIIMIILGRYNYDKIITVPNAPNDVRIIRGGTQQ